MHISYYTIKAGLNPAVGFGYAGQNIVRTLQELGHKVDFANPKADFQLNFTQPHHYKLHESISDWLYSVGIYEDPSRMDRAYEFV